MEFRDIHNKGARYKYALGKLEEASVLPHNKELVLKFDQFEQVVGKKLETRRKTMNLLRRFAGWFGSKKFEDVSREDLQQLFQDTILKEKMSPATLNDYRKVIKKFYKWLLGDNDQYPRVVSWIKIHTLTCKVTPSDMISEDELKRMIDAADHPRDKALIATLFNSQARISEFLNLRIGNIEFNGDGAFLSVPQEKGQQDVSYRRVFIDFAVPYLASWLQLHPRKEDPEAFVWVHYGARSHDELMTYSAVRMLLIRIGARAGVKKPLKPHNFRHSGNTYLAGLGVNPQTLAMRNGHNSLKMAMIYTHLGAGDDRNAILRAKGLKKEEKVTQLLVRKCAKCKSDNPPTATRCDTCGCDLNTTENVMMSQMQNTIVSQDERIKNLEQMIQSMAQGRVVNQS